MKLGDWKKHGDWKKLRLKIDWKKRKPRLDWGRVTGFCRKNIRYLSSGVIVGLLVAVLAVTAATDSGRDGGNNPEDEDGAEQGFAGLQEAFREDALPEVNALIEQYYAAYTAGDLEALGACATPVSELEQGYIALMSQYISAYENVKCYTKQGLSEDEYAVSVAMDMRFEGMETAAPGLDFFYVRKNSSGGYYIDNLYSQFNYQNLEQEMDSQVAAFIVEYESQEDLLSLIADVQGRYEAALAADEGLKGLVEITIPDAIQIWVEQVTGETVQPTEEPEEGSEDTPGEPAENSENGNNQ